MDSYNSRNLDLVMIQGGRGIVTGILVIDLIGIFFYGSYSGLGSSL